MTAFFIPGIAHDSRIVEHAYDEMRGVVELELGRRPNGRRIAKLWTRRGGTDCMMEVGIPDPLRGGTVMAIFDMGQHRPFVVWWRADGRVPNSARVQTHRASTHSKAVNIAPERSTARP